MSSVGPIKTCTSCHDEFPATPEFFSRQKRGLYGLEACCKKCKSKIRKAKRDADIELYRSQHNARRARQSDEAKEKRREKDRVRARKIRAIKGDELNAKRRSPEFRAKIRERENAKYRSDAITREKRKEQSRAFYYANSDKILPKVSERQRKPETRERIRGWYHGKWASDPGYRLRCCISSQVRQSIINGKRGLAWESLVGYSAADLMAHLEPQFKPGMTWGNYGEWHIDHKLPVASFCFSSPEDEDFKKCWALSNLQPLWKQENLQKGSKILAAYCNQMAGLPASPLEVR